MQCTFCRKNSTFYQSSFYAVYLLSQELNTLSEIVQRIPVVGVTLDGGFVTLNKVGTAHHIFSAFLLSLFLNCDSSKQFLHR